MKTFAIELLLLIILLFCFWMFVDILEIKRNSDKEVRYLEQIERQNHMMLLYKEIETHKDIIYIDSTNTYSVRNSELFPK